MMGAPGSSASNPFGGGPGRGPGGPSMRGRGGPPPMPGRPGGPAMPGSGGPPPMR